MLVIVNTLRATITFTSFDKVVEGLKTNTYTDIEKELIAKKACNLLNTSDLDHDMIEYYKHIFGYYLAPVIY